MIKLTGLTKRYPGRTVTANAVDGLDLDIPEGKLVALLGPSGCGKTTTLRMIAGLERNDRGTIEIDGKVASDPSRGIFAGADKRPIGIVFQSYAIWPHMTVAQNVMFPLRVGKPRVSRAAAHERALEALDMVGSLTSPPAQRPISPAASSSVSLSLARSCGSPRCFFSTA